MGVLIKLIYTLTPHIGVLEKEFLDFCKTRFYLPFHPSRQLESRQRGRQITISWKCFFPVLEHFEVDYSKGLRFGGGNCVEEQDNKNDNNSI